ncbi:MAG: hypothetical protein JWQ02_3807 [Capsulimonas sp.]|nr:hypothetical protein [Capsulimonas sp.]
MNNRLKFPLIALALAAVCCLTGCNHAQTKTATATPPSAASTAAYHAAFTTWSTQSQHDAERLLENDVIIYPNDQRLAFFRAACMRSRFDIPKARPLLEKVVELDPNSSMGQCASDILRLDEGTDLVASSNNLNALSEQKPVDPIVLWLNGIECRSFHQSEEGVRVYKQLLSIIPKPGPVLAHQTYANMLDETGDHKEALVHRLIAVKQEPAPWSYNGLANTLDRLGRPEDAAKVRQAAAEGFRQ